MSFYFIAWLFVLDSGIPNVNAAQTFIITDRAKESMPGILNRVVFEIINNNGYNNGNGENVIRKRVNKQKRLTHELSKSRHLYQEKNGSSKG